jgi:hypothetical protein
VFLETRGDAYGFQGGKDAKAVAELLRLSGGNEDEAERRWRVGLGEAGFRRCDTLHDLSTKWNAYTGGRAAAVGLPKGIVVEALKLVGINVLDDEWGAIDQLRRLADSPQAIRRRAEAFECEVHPYPRPSELVAYWDRLGEAVARRAAGVTA